jgi:hypothetical protein
VPYLEGEIEGSMSEDNRQSASSSVVQVHVDTCEYFSSYVLSHLALRVVDTYAFPRTSHS